MFDRIAGLTFTHANIIWLTKCSVMSSIASTGPDLFLLRGIPLRRGIDKLAIRIADSAVELRDPATRIKPRPADSPSYRRTAVIAGGNKHGKAVIEGHPDQSPLIRILKGELAPKMPMGKSLSRAEIARIAEWIRDSATIQGWSVPRDWRWPFQKPVKRDPPPVKNAVG